MRGRILMGAIAVGALGALVVAAPASAATTISDVTDVSVVWANQTNFVGDYEPWEPEGPATFPSVVEVGDGGTYVLQGYQPTLPAAPAGCSVEILSFSADIEALQPIDSLGSQVGFWVGLPALGVEGTTAQFDGVGTVVDAGGELFGINPQNDDVDGTVVVTLPEPITPDTVPFGWIGFFTGSGSDGPLWQVNSVRYQVATTCPDVPVLPATGPVAPSLGFLAALSLIAVGGAIALYRTRARA